MISSKAVRSQITEAQKIASGGGSEQDIAEAKIEVEVSGISSYTVASIANKLQVLESLQSSLK